MTSPKNPEKLFRIHFRDPKNSDIVSLQAQSIQDSPLGLSFVCISDFVFEDHGLVIKPSEEQMKAKLENVKCLHISIYSVISIEELGSSNKKLKFKKDKSNLVMLPRDL
jgi:hypothetical protein